MAKQHKHSFEKPVIQRTAILCKSKENISNIIITGRNGGNATSVKQKLNCNYILDKYTGTRN